jgi:hypothetical protein
MYLWVSLINSFRLIPRHGIGGHMVNTFLGLLPHIAKWPYKKSEQVLHSPQHCAKEPISLSFSSNVLICLL